MMKNLEKRIWLPVVVIVIAVIIGGALLTYFFLKEAKIDQEDEIPQNNLIKVDSPQPNQEIQSSFVVEGEARGYWFFEATFPIKLLDKDGNLLEQTFAQAQGEWMTEDFVPFKSVLTFSVSEDQEGTLVLEKDNPSGLPENADEIRIPVMLIKGSSVQTRTIKLYYYSPELDKDNEGNILCSRKGLVAVEREIPITITPIQDSINLLISGDLTEAERAQGITSEYPLEGFSLTGASLNNGILTFEFNDPNNKTGGGSCRTGILWFQIEATAKQFPEIQQVRFSPDYLFQP